MVALPCLWWHCRAADRPGTRDATARDATARDATARDATARDVAARDVTAGSSEGGLRRDADEALSRGGAK